MDKKKERGPLSQSFVMGVIALVFLILGYQTALFLHHAAVTKIASNRDCPDTVYVYRTVESDYSVLHTSAHQTGIVHESVRKPVGYDGLQKDSVVRRNAAHSKRVQTVRDNLPVRKVESFVFNPNTVSVEDLCRLGFTPKQAASIDNYRKKGGRFHRKTDFARSFVVSDSVYARLEKYIEIPLLDLNVADSAAFDALPGIGGWFAQKMLEHRKALGGYSYKEQLMDIWKFTEEKYDALSDLVTVSPEHVRPYPIWTFPADSLRLHPYIGDWSAKGIVLYRENNPREKWTIEGLKSNGVLKPENADKLSRCYVE